MTPLILSQFGIWTLGTLGVIDLIAATTNAFNGALLARRPDHYKHFTVMGVIILGYAGGIGGGVLRDVLVNRVPSPLANHGISSSALRQQASLSRSPITAEYDSRTACSNS